MAGRIKITPDQMRSRAGEYRVQADAVHTVIDKMDQLLRYLQDEWEGASSQAYAARFNELRPGFVNAESLIREIAQSLDTTAQTLESTDNQIASQFKG